MFPSSHRIARAVALLCVIACASCDNPQPSAAVLAQTNFPVVEPFAVERAGSTLTVEFELPDAREGTELRPVFIGIQRVSDPAGGSASELQRLIRIDEYLLRKALTVRLMLVRVDAGVLGPSIELQEPTVNDGQSPAVQYTPLVNGVSVRHTNVTVDGSEALAVGKYDLKKVYYSVQLARIDPPTPGRYRLTAESLSSHPQLKDATLQLVVSHHHQKAIY